MSFPRTCLLWTALLICLTVSYCVADDYAIEHGARTLQVDQGMLFFSDPSFGDTHGASTASNALWDMAGSRGVHSPVSSGRSRYHIGYDGSGKVTDVTTGHSKSRWIFEDTDAGTALQVAEGPLKGMYLAVGSERVELLGNDGKMHPVGWNVVLSKTPTYFTITEVSK